MSFVNTYQFVVALESINANLVSRTVDWRGVIPGTAEDIHPRRELLRWTAFVEQDSIDYVCATSAMSSSVHYT